MRMVWANDAAVRLWGASSMQELCGRDFSQVSEATRTRNLVILDRIARGETCVEQWTFYPKGVCDDHQQAATAMAHHRRGRITYFWRMVLSIVLRCWKWQVPTTVRCSLVPLYLREPSQPNGQLVMLVQGSPLLKSEV
jgi:hypothetical protein